MHGETMKFANTLLSLAQRSTVPRSHTIRRARTCTHTRTRTHARWESFERMIAIRRSCYFHNTKQTQETNIHGFRGIRSGDHNNQAASYLRLRTHGYRYRQITPRIFCNKTYGRRSCMKLFNCFRPGENRTKISRQ
jgi:hypothetical protein